jgi:hypothetical protein
MYLYYTIDCPHFGEVGHDHPATKAVFVPGKLSMAATRHQYRTENLKVALSLTHLASKAIKLEAMIFATKLQPMAVLLRIPYDVDRMEVARVEYSARHIAADATLDPEEFI